MSNNRLTLFHGSDHIIEKPRFGAGKKYNDYGQGLYCTCNRELSKEWACPSMTQAYPTSTPSILTDSGST